VDRHLLSPLLSPAPSQGLRRALACLALSFALAGCNGSRAVPQAGAPADAPARAFALAPGVTPPDFRMPEGEGCAGEVARWRAIQDNDLATGHVSRQVHERIRKDIDAAAAACAAGQDAQARALVRASRQRNGYPG
jgi:hypothetical protein